MKKKVGKNKQTKGMHCRNSDQGRLPYEDSQYVTETSQLNFLKKCPLKNSVLYSWRLLALAGGQGTLNHV